MAPWEPRLGRDTPGRDNRTLIHIPKAHTNSPSDTRGSWCFLYPTLGALHPNPREGETCKDQNDEAGRTGTLIASTRARLASTLG